MNPQEILQRIQQDAQAQGIDASALAGVQAPVQDPNIPVIPETGTGIDLVSYVQSISDGIIAASPEDVIAMIAEIASVRRWAPQEVLPTELPTQ